MRLARMALALVFSLALGCSSAPEKPKNLPKTQKDGHHLRRLALHNVQARRDRPGCQPLISLFDPLPLSDLRACLKSVPAGTEVRYELVRERSPFFRLEDAAKAPVCLRATLPTILVPREIVFQSADEGELRCYSSSLDLEADEIFGVKVPIHGLELKLAFPLGQVPDEDRDLEHLVGSWAISPFFQESESRREIASIYVPHRICEQCFGATPLYGPHDRPIYWP